MFLQSAPMEDAFRSKHSIATSRWMTPDEVEGRFLRRDGDFWIGRNPYRDENPIGFGDDRHVMVVSGSRGGKGVSVIVPNLCLWPGSLVVVDPKGENATLTAARRGDGSEHCDGMGQSVYVLDPMGVATVEDKYRARFNPLDALDPDSEHVIDDATRLADAIVEVRQGEDRQWDEGARSLVRTLILYVLTNPRFEGRRNLLTVRRLIQRGDWEAHERDKARRAEAEKPIKSPQVSAHVLLWELAAQSTALGGIIAAAADGFLQSARMGPKQYESYRKIADTNTEFLDSPGMARCVEASDFDLSDIKTDPGGVSVYLSLPQRYMSTHYRWLRMMIALTITEMEVVPGRPAAGDGSPILLAMDEFAGLKRMEIIENTVAQIAGYGVKLFFVLQSLEQLKSVYPDRWETFLANCGVRIFFATTDNFTNQYVSDSLGEQEIVRIVRNRSKSSGESTSRSEGSSESQSEQESTARTRGETVGNTRGGSRGRSTGGNQSTSRSSGSARNQSVSFEPEWFFAMEGLLRDYTGRQEGRSTNENRGSSRGKSWSDNMGRNWSHNRSRTSSQTVTKGTTTTSSRSTQTGSTRSSGLSEGESEQIFKKPLVTKDEMAKLFTRIDDPAHRAYPGIALVTVAGEVPMLLRRTPYYQDPAFFRLFDPHPDHPMLDVVKPQEQLQEPERNAWPRKHGYKLDGRILQSQEANDRLKIRHKERKHLFSKFHEKEYKCTIHAPFEMVLDLFLDLEIQEKWFLKPNMLLGEMPPSGSLSVGSQIPCGFIEHITLYEKDGWGATQIRVCALSQNFNKPMFYDFTFRPHGAEHTKLFLTKFWHTYPLRSPGIFPRNDTHPLSRGIDHDLIPHDANNNGWSHVAKDDEVRDVREPCLNFKHLCEDVYMDGCPSFDPQSPYEWIVAHKTGVLEFPEDTAVGLPLHEGDHYNTQSLPGEALYFGHIDDIWISLKGSGTVLEILINSGDYVEKGERILKCLPD